MKEIYSFYDFFDSKRVPPAETDARLVRMEKLYNVSSKMVEKSPSHDRSHIQLTLKYAWLLLNEAKAKELPLDSEKVFAAVCCHDFGRTNPLLHGSESLKESVFLASEVLEGEGYMREEVQAVCQIIREHDQPEYVPTSLEARILKEADFLAGMGEWGILRTILWAGESGRNIGQIIEILEERMPNRITSLEFATSKAIAWKEWPVVRLFLTGLKEQYQSKEVEVFPGKYIILEGISGSGKDTQAKLLAEYLRNQNLQVEIINEPSDLGRHTLGLWKSWHGILSEVTEGQKAFLTTADRVAISKEIKSALKKGKVVLGVRSLVSTMVYQGETELMVAEIMLNNRFVPRPEAIILLDILPSKAFERIEGRAITQGTTKGDYEKIDLLDEMCHRYKEAISLLSPVTKVLEISSEKPKEKVFEEILLKLKGLKILD